MYKKDHNNKRITRCHLHRATHYSSKEAETLQTITHKCQRPHTIDGSFCHFQLAQSSVWLSRKKTGTFSTGVRQHCLNAGECFIFLTPIHKMQAFISECDLLIWKMAVKPSRFCLEADHQTAQNCPLERWQAARSTTQSSDQRTLRSFFFEHFSSDHWLVWICALNMKQGGVNSEDTECMESHFSISGNTLAQF